MGVEDQDEEEGEEDEEEEEEAAEAQRDHRASVYGRHAISFLPCFMVSIVVLSSCHLMSSSSTNLATSQTLIAASVLSPKRPFSVSAVSTSEPSTRTLRRSASEAMAERWDASRQPPTYVPARCCGAQPSTQSPPRRR